MGRAEQDAILETAIVSTMRDDEMVAHDDLLTGFVVVAAFKRDSGGTRLAYWVPEHQPVHTSIGMLTLVDDFIRDDGYTED